MSALPTVLGYWQEQGVNEANRNYSRHPVLWREKVFCGHTVSEAKERRGEKETAI